MMPGPSYRNGPPAGYRGPGNPVQGSMAPPMQAGPGQQGYAYNTQEDPGFLKGYNEMPPPGDVHDTPKKRNTERVQILVLGMIIGGVIMYKVFPIFNGVIKVIFGG